MIAEQIEHVLTLPESDQVGAARTLIASLPAADPEAWNTTFGPDSLFEAWTRTSIARSVHTALSSRIGWYDGMHAVDVGGGNGSLWRHLSPDATGRITVVDPLSEAIERVRSAVPAGVQVEGCVGLVQDVELPSCDTLVCSMTLHHLAGSDAADRAAHGLDGPGKIEVLRRFGATGARIFLVEADVDCDLDLPSGSAQLADNIFDSYVRRCGRSLISDLSTAPDSLRPRWEHVLRHWFLEQIAVADLPLAERDVYELTVDRWKSLFPRAGLSLIQHTPVDAWNLFQLYVLEARS